MSLQIHFHTRVTEVPSARKIAKRSGSLQDFSFIKKQQDEADQTPTQTGFLKNCEEVGFFSELPNPFDGEFSRASEINRDTESISNDTEEQGNIDSSSSAHTDIENYDTLEAPSWTDVSATPTVEDTDSTAPITALPQPVSSTMHKKEALMAAKDVVTQTLPRLAKEIIPISIIKVEPISPAVPANIKVEPISPAVQASIKVEPMSPAVQAVTMVTSRDQTVVSVQPLTKSTTVPASLASINMPSLNTIPISAPTLLRLPNGQTIPVVPPSVANPAVQIPLAVSAMEETQPHASDTAAVDDQASVKMKLKSALLTNQSQGNLGVMTQAVGVVTRQQTVTSTSSQNSNHSVSNISTVWKRRRSSADDNDNKRERFLERTRAATTRCRNKRKQWITNLEGKAENLNSSNLKLRNEVTALRDEVAQLKQLLLAHRDCPVTMLQRKSQAKIRAGSGAADWQAANEISIDNSQPEIMEVIATSDVQQQVQQQVNQQVYQVTLSADQKPTIITLHTISDAPQGAS